MVAYLIVSIALIMLCFYLWNLYCLAMRDHSCKLPLPPGRMGLPIFGEMFNFLLWGVNFQRSRRRQYGKVYRTHLFGSPTIIVTGEEYVKHILMGEGHLVETRWPYTTRQILGTDGIVNGDPNTHVRVKKLTVRAFSPKCMKNYSSTIQSIIRKHVQMWKNQGDVCISEACRQMVANTMMTVLLGIHENDPDMENYIRAADGIINSILCIPLDTPWSAWRKGKKSKSFIYENLRLRLTEKFEESDVELFGCHINTENVTPTTALDLVANKRDSVLVNIIKFSRLEKGNEKISLTNLQNLSLEFIFAGTQSLQCSSSSMLMHLSRHPEVFEKLRKEINGLGLFDSPITEISYEDLNKLKYTQCIVNEVLRVTPPIPGAVRVAKKTFELKGYQIPRGWQIVYSIRETHEIAGGAKKNCEPYLRFDPTYFDCDKCQMKKKKDKTHSCHYVNGSHSFIPFGKGKRMCVGKNYANLVLKLLAIELARSVTFDLINEPRMIEIPMTKPAKTVIVNFKPCTA